MSYEDFHRELQPRFPLPHIFCQTSPMKRLTITICLTILVCFTSSTAWSEGFLCSNIGILCPKTVDESRTVERQGLKYEVNSQTTFTGYVIAKYVNGQLQEKGHFKDGKRDGLVEVFNEDGTVDKKYTGTYKDRKKIKQTPVTHFLLYFNNLNSTNPIFFCTIIE